MSRAGPEKITVTPKHNKQDSPWRQIVHVLSFRLQIQRPSPGWSESGQVVCGTGTASQKAPSSPPRRDWVQRRPCRRRSAVVHELQG